MAPTCLTLNCLWHWRWQLQVPFDSRSRILSRLLPLRLKADVLDVLDESGPAPAANTTAETLMRRVRRLPRGWAMAAGASESEDGLNQEATVRLPSSWRRGARRAFRPSESEDGFNQEATRRGLRLRLRPFLRIPWAQARPPPSESEAGRSQDNALVSTSGLEAGASHEDSCLGLLLRGILLLIKGAALGKARTPVMFCYTIAAQSCEHFVLSRADHLGI